jgi:hypothetical protein
MDKLFGKKDIKGNQNYTKLKWLFFFVMFHLVCLFFSKIEEVKEQNKVLRGAQRDIDRDRYHIEREKKRIVTHF